jgi:ligand-binding SRPBCC domain-containing protein
MVSGPFRRFSHDHLFERRGTGTWMRDVFDYASPFGPLGKLVDALFLRRHMLRLLEERNAVLKRVAEGGASAVKPVGDRLAGGGPKR